MSNYMLEEERISWTVEGQTLELQTLESQQKPLQIQELPLEVLIDRCIVPIDYKNNKDSIDRINKIKESLVKNKTVDPIIVLQDKQGKVVRILDGNHRVRVYQEMGKKKITGKILKEGKLKDNQRILLMERI